MIIISAAMFKIRIHLPAFSSETCRISYDSANKHKLSLHSTDRMVFLKEAYCLFCEKRTKSSWTKYSPLLKRMQVTCTSWVVYLNTSDDGREKTCRSCQKHSSLSLIDFLLLVAICLFHL